MVARFSNKALGIENEVFEVENYRSALNVGFCPKGSSETKIKESASYHKALGIENEAFEVGNLHI